MLVTSVRCQASRLKARQQVLDACQNGFLDSVDPLGADELCLNENFHVLAHGWLRKTELFGDEHAA